MANSVDPDEMPRSVASHLGLHCLLRHIYPNTYDKYGMFIIKYNMLSHTLLQMAENKRKNNYLKNYAD